MKKRFPQTPSKKLQSVTGTGYIQNWRFLYIHSKLPNTAGSKSIVFLCAKASIINLFLLHKDFRKGFGKTFLQKGFPENPHFSNPHVKPFAAFR
ncbi:MAG: hypothetical protein J6I42_12335, partial [Clostridia bacterium]|nr:hypothetical protein [Clostridia bacterium]